MEVTDLRIKNWVKVENDYEQIVAIDTYNVKCSLSKADGVWQHKSDIRPIPLWRYYVLLSNGLRYYNRKPARNYLVHNQ